MQGYVFTWGKKRLVNGRLFEHGRGVWVAKVKVMLPEALKPKLLTGCVGGLQEMGTAIPRGLVNSVPAECSQESAVIGMAQMAPPGGVTKQGFLGRGRLGYE